MGRDKDTLLRKFHQARWDEEIIFEQSVPGERGILVPKVCSAIESEVGVGTTIQVLLPMVEVKTSKAIDYSYFAISFKSMNFCFCPNEQFLF